MGAFFLLFKKQKTGRATVPKERIEMKLQIDVTKETSKRLDMLCKHVQKNRLAAPTHKQRLAGDILAAALPEWEKDYGATNQVFGPEKMLEMVECIDHHKQNGASGIAIYPKGWKIYYDKSEAIDSGIVKPIKYPTQGHWLPISEEDGEAIAKMAWRFSGAKCVEKMTPNEESLKDHWAYSIHWPESGAAFGDYPDAV